MIMAKKGYIYPIKKKIPLILLLNLFGSFIVSQFFPFVNRFCEFYKITFRKGQQRLFGVSGRLPPSLLHKGAVAEMQAKLESVYPDRNVYTII